MTSHSVATDTVYIVDDDNSVREALTMIFEMEGFKVQSFGTGDAFLSDLDQLTPASLLLDVHMPGRSGLDVLRSLGENAYPAPVFAISGQGDIPTAVSAIKQGALDFIEKPFDGDRIVNQVREAIQKSQQDGSGPETTQKRFPGMEKLTDRELDVMREIVAGASNKEAGINLGISSRTVEVHRARVMEKLGARNTADLVRIALNG